MKTIKFMPCHCGSTPTIKCIGKGGEAFGYIRILSAECPTCGFKRETRTVDISYQPDSVAAAETTTCKKRLAEVWNKAQLTFSEIDMTGNPCSFMKKFRCL